MSDQIECRVHVSVGGKPLGALVLIDPENEWMQVYLKAGWLVPTSFATVAENPGVPLDTEPVVEDLHVEVPDASAD